MRPRARLLTLPMIALSLAAGPATQPASQPAAIADLPERLLPPAVRSAGDVTIAANAHPHATAINAAIAAARQGEVKPTDVDRSTYLTFIERQVAVMKTYQDADGRIIDPIEKREVQYATPCFAHAVSVLASSGRTHDVGLIEAGMRAMDRAVWAMVNAKAPDNHGDFFTWPVMLALAEYQQIAPPERWGRWRTDLARIDPSKLYNFYNNRQSLNWVLVHTAGEFLRNRHGMTGPDYVEAMLSKQDHHFTDDGMYAEGGQPIAYDLFSRLFVTGMLAHGYSGGHADVLRQRMWKGAWMSLLMQSPTGEAPTGHRSSQHIWVEAEQCVILEAFANAYAKAGKPVEASIFKRGARLSLAAMNAWVRPDGTGYVVKNRFPIEAKFGYESYSTHSQYNLLACSMAAQAYQLADDSIPEGAAPADVGGYTLVVEPFHKAFASAGGGYVEYELRGDTDDRNWVPCGLVRIHLVGANPQLSPADGVGVYENKGAADDPNYAVGPAWRSADGKWTRLASLRPTAAPKVESVEATPARAKLRVVHTLDGGLSVDELITVEPKQITVTATVTGGDVQAVRAYFPMLIDDGAEPTTVREDGARITLSKSNGGAVQFDVDGATQLTRAGTHVKSRNGVVEPVFGEVSGRSVTYHIRTP